MIVTVLVSVRYLQPDPAAAEAAAAHTAQQVEAGSATTGWRSRIGIWRDRRTC